MLIAWLLKPLPQYHNQKRRAKNRSRGGNPRRGSIFPDPRSGGSIGPTNILSPQTTPEKSIFPLSLFVRAITGIIFVVLFTLLVYSLAMKLVVFKNDALAFVELERRGSSARRTGISPGSGSMSGAFDAANDHLTRKPRALAFSC